MLEDTLWGRWVSSLIEPAGKFVMRLLIPLMGADRWEEDPAFEEIPLPLLEGSRWRTLSCGRWLFDVDILHLESRGVNRAVSRAANCRPCCDCRILFF